ncbi:PqqD family protein [Oricola sp.]|uniref:PqqD family protein n=1 Tax=Oricola sp. TaxID=1979950 RepID=UPI003BAB73FE
MTLDASRSRATAETRLELASAASVNPLGTGEGGVVLNSASGRLYTVNDTALAFLRELDGKRSVSEIAERLSEEFAQNHAIILRDLIPVANLLIDAAVIRVLR